MGLGGTGGTGNEIVVVDSPTTVVEAPDDVLVAAELLLESPHAVKAVTATSEEAMSTSERERIRLSGYPQMTTSNRRVNLGMAAMAGAPRAKAVRRGQAECSAAQRQTATVLRRSADSCRWL